MSAEILPRKREYHGWLKLKRQYVYPFRWFYQSHIWGLRFRVRNCLMFADALWHWDWIDYAPTLRLMEIAFRHISRMQAKHGHLVSSDRTAKQTLIIAELCRRLEADDYETLAGYDAEGRRHKRGWVEHSNYLAKQDIEYFGRIFRYVRHWWN
jgi:hypothetical protein